MEIVQALIVPPLPTTERGHGLHIDGTLVKEKRLLYCNGATVIQRWLDEPNTARINTEHAQRVMTAKFSPNGEWICSGDAAGQIYIWAHKSFVVKNTIAVGKKCLDLAWSKDGQRIVAVGDGKDEMGKVFPWNTNNKLGTLTGAQKTLLSCDFKPTRPFRVITGSEDSSVYYYKGPPFKFEASNKDHENFVNCVRFSPDGTKYVSVSSDKSMRIYDAKTAKEIAVLCPGTKKSIKSGHHSGSIYSVCWNKDGSRLLTSSADKSCKVWDSVSGELLHTFRTSAKPALADMQLTCLWLENYIISVSLNGHINYFDPECSQEMPIKVLMGHKGSIKDCDYDAKSNLLYSVDQDAKLVRTECKTGEAVELTGDTHKATGLSFVRTSCDGLSVYTVGVNDTLVKSPLSVDDEKGNRFGEKMIKLDGAAKAMAVGNVDPKLVIVGTHKNKLIVVSDFDQNSVSEIKLAYTPTSCCLSKDDQLLCVGSGRDGEHGVYFYDVKGGKEVFKLMHKQLLSTDVLSVAITPDGQFLATAMKDKNIWIWNMEEVKAGKAEMPVNATRGFKFHSGQLASVEWSPDSKWLLSAAFDSNLYLFMKPTEGKSDNIHLDHAFNGLIKKAMFLDQNKIVAIGDDASIRFFDIQKKE